MSPVNAVVKPYTFGLESVASSTQVNQNFDILYGGQNAVVALLNTVETAVNNSTVFTRATKYDSFAAAVASQGTSETTLYIDTEMAVTADITVPSTITLYFGRGGSLNIAITKTVTVQGGLVAGPFIIAKGLGTLNLHAAQIQFVFPEWWSATGGIKEAVTNACEAGVIVLQRKIYTEAAKIPVTKRGVKILGVIGDRNDSNIKGTQINFTANDAFFELGSDSGNDWDSDEYNGKQTFELEDLSMKYTGGTVLALSNGAGNYGTNTVGIRDWRGGTIRTKNVQVENVDYAFWGIQSDINELDLTILYCERGVYAGPRSDQLELEKLYALYCTQALIIDGPTAWVRNLILKECGHEAKCPVEIRQTSADNRQCHFGQVWVEDYGGGTASYVNGFFDIGISAGNQGAATGYVKVVVDEITYLNHPTPPRTKHIAQVGKGFIRLRNPIGDFNNMDSLIDFTGGYDNTLAGGHLEGPSYLEDKAYSNSGGGTPKMTWLLEGPAGLVFGSSSNKQLFYKIGTTGVVDAAKSYGIYMAVDSQLVIDQPELETDNNTILHLNRRHYQGLVANPGDIPVGPHGPFTLRRGDDYTVTNATSGQPYKYVCTATGTYGDYAALENRTATTTLTTPTVVTLSAATTKLFKEQTIAIAGAGVAGATLNTTIVSVAANGLSIVIADAASTAGAGLAISFRAPTTKTLSLS
jgi:hypothetical protein